MGAALVLLLVGLGAMAAGVLIGRYYVPDDRQLRRTARHSKAYMRALSHLVARDHDTVIAELRNVVEENVEDAEPYFALGAIFRSRGEHERAIRVHQALAVRERDKRKLRQRAMYELGLDFRAAGMPRRATRAMEEVVLQEPGHEGALRVLAALYEEQARFNEAAGLWQRLGRRRGEDTSRREHHLLVAAAQSALGRDDLDSARQLLKAAQKLHETAHFFAAAAELAAARGNHRGAKERLTQALIAEPGLAPHLLPGLIAAEHGLAREVSGDRHGDDLDDNDQGDVAQLASAARPALPAGSASDARRTGTQPLVAVSSAGPPALAVAASRTTQIGVGASDSLAAVTRTPVAGAGTTTPSQPGTLASHGDVSQAAAPGATSSSEGSAASASPAASSSGEAAAAAVLASPRAGLSTEERAALGPAPALEDHAAGSPSRSDAGSADGSPEASAGGATTAEDSALVRSPAPSASAAPQPPRSPTLAGIPLVPAQRPSASVADRVLAVLAEIEAQSGPRLELALIRAQLVPPADIAGRAELARELAARFPEALAARVATARLALAGGDPAAIVAALDALVSEGGALAWALRGRWQCSHCGHRPGPFSWRCGQCRRWGTLRMETGVDPAPIPPRERRAAPRVARAEALLGASPDDSLPAATLDPGLSDAELATAGVRRSLLGRVGGWVSSVWRRGP